MEFEPDISKLENVVNRLLGEYELLKGKCEKLTINLAESKAEVEELKDEKMSLLQDKDTIHSQVSSILNKLTEWEDGLDHSDTGAKTPSSSDAGGQLFSMGESS